MHIEGPFLNVRRKGIHDASKFRELDDRPARPADLARVGRTLVTLAPEKTSPEMIAPLVQRRASWCRPATPTPAMRRSATALDHGLSGFTHLFNAMSPLTSREPGVVGAALEDQTSWCGIIVDGRHVDPVVLKIALQVQAARPVHAGHRRHAQRRHAARRLQAAGPHHLGERRRLRRRARHAGRLEPRHGRRRAQRGHLLGLDLATAVRMASRNPAELLGLGHELGRIAPGYRADLVLATDALEVLETWIGGEELAETALRAPPPARAI